jgi:hypothetical protein
MVSLPGGTATCPPGTVLDVTVEPQSAGAVLAVRIGRAGFNDGHREVPVEAGHSLHTGKPL